MCSLEEAELIAEFFLAEYGVEFKVRCDKRQREGKQFYLQANTKASHELVGVVHPHIIPSMAYKVAHVADLMLHECREPIGACVDCGAPVYEARRKGRCTRCYSRFMYKRRVMR